MLIMKAIWKDWTGTAMQGPPSAVKSWSPAGTTSSFINLPLLLVVNDTVGRLPVNEGRSGFGQVWDGLQGGELQS